MLRGSLSWTVFAASGLLLAACGSHAPAPTAHAPAAPTYSSGHSQGNYKVGRAYQIQGTWYYPKEDWSYDETGIASWYGEQFHGRYTADGEIFDLNTLTAAHRTLPMPVVVRVTNLENGRSIKLRVNDRGPYARGRIIDVSRHAAQLLGFEGQGTAKVRVQIDYEESMIVASAAGRAGSAPPPSAATVVADIVSAPLVLPVSALEAMSGRDEPKRPAPAPAVAAAPAGRVRVADLHPIAAPPPPRPTPVRVAETRPTPLPTPHPARPSGDRPYITDDLPGEPTAPHVVAEADSTPPPPLPAKVEIAAVKPTQIYVQAGAFSDQGNAMRLQDRLRALGSPVDIKAGVTGGGAPIYRVRVGPAANVDAADALLNRVLSGGAPQARIVVD
jgi:rare lipoprotein A